jgi:uncharacterized repeat protein (TIGR04076 family)
MLAGIRISGEALAKSKGSPLVKASSVMEANMQEEIAGVQLKVISQKGTCGLGHRVGDTCTFTETGLDGKLCIHAMYSVLPKVFAMMYDAKFPWLKDGDVATHACPDATNPVVFEVKRLRT